MSTKSPFQLILDDSRFEGFLHPEVDGRVPVRVYCAKECPDLTDVAKFGAPVERVDEAGEAPVIEIEVWEQSDSKVEARLSYAIEGVVAQFALERGTDGWGVADAKVAEQ